MSFRVLRVHGGGNRTASARQSTSGLQLSFHGLARTVSRVTNIKSFQLAGTASHVEINRSGAVFHEVFLGVGEHDFVGGSHSGEEGTVDRGREILGGRFAGEEDPVFDGHADLAAQALFGADGPWKGYSTVSSRKPCLLTKRRTFSTVTRAISLSAS